MIHIQVWRKQFLICYYCPSLRDVSGRKLNTTFNKLAQPAAKNGTKVSGDWDVLGPGAKVNSVYKLRGLHRYFLPRITMEMIALLTLNYDLRWKLIAHSCYEYICHICQGCFIDIGVIVWLHQGAVAIRKTVLPGMAIPMLKIRRPNGRLIFNMEITIRR